MHTEIPNMTHAMSVPGRGATGSLQTATAEPMIVAESLTKRFGRVTAVDHVSFEVQKGAIFGFLGPNGSGKSTVIRMLCGLLEPSSGRAMIAGLDVTRQTEQIKGIIGYMSQKFSLYDELTALENLRFYGRLYGLSARALAARITELIDLLGLAPYLNSYAGVLSGGWRQRLAMACALVHNPQVLFLDEPTAGIDPVARRQLWDLLFEFSAHGMTLFVATHYMDEAERCTHVGYIYMSRLKVWGTPEELKQLPAVTPPDTRRLEISCDHVTLGLRAIKRLPGVRSATVFGQSITVLVDAGMSEQEIITSLTETGIHKVDVRPVAASLEDVFVALTSGMPSAGQHLQNSHSQQVS